ncbi:MAG: dTDP-4-dehydrorhamnose 3,5-epimerase [Bacteroidales bacterium]|nr:dTDP-4-dehydrorhamnose 3,5-epimerase [Bacteroidales bacterium]
MKFTETKLKGSYIIELELQSDERGFFARVFCKNEFEDIGLANNIVQINDSYNKCEGTLRGMHYQSPPKAEDKIVRCIAGSIYDVIIDIRKNSKTFGQWFGVELSAENRKMIFVPKGFAHGFLTMKDNTEVLYYPTEYYSPEYEGGIRYNDPKIGIQWPHSIIRISKRDERYELISDNFEGIII